MKSDLCTDCDWGKGIDRFDVYLVINTEVERGDKVRVGGVEGHAVRDVGKEVLPYELILRAPNFPSLFMEDSVEVWVSRGWVSARRSSEKVWEKIEVIGDFIEGGRRLYSGSGNWGWAMGNKGQEWANVLGGRQRWAVGCSQLLR